MGEPLISIIVPTFDEPPQFLEALRFTLETQTFKDAELIIFQNKAEVDKEGKILKAECSLSQSRHAGALQAKGKYFLFVDCDNELDSKCVQYLLETIQDDPQIGIVAPIGVFPIETDSIMEGGANRSLLTGMIDSLYYAKWTAELYPPFREGIPYEVDEVSNVFMVSRECYEKVGGLDFQNFPIDLDEADFCLRVKKLGYKIVVDIEARVKHKKHTKRWQFFKRPQNAYYQAKHKVVFHKKHKAPFLFWWFFFPLVTLGHTVFLLLFQRKMLGYYLVGTWDGLKTKPVG